MKKTSNDDGNTSGFWTGSKGLTKTFWLYFIVANMVLNLWMSLVKEMDALILLLVISIIWNILAVVGVFNAADIYKSVMIKKGQGYGWATASKIACVVLILSAIGNAL